MKHIVLILDRLFACGRIAPKWILPTVSGLAVLSLILFIVLAGRKVGSQGEATTIADSRIPQLSVTATVTATKWWFHKTSVTDYPITPQQRGTLFSATSTGNCGYTATTSLAPQIYGFIADKPPLPNRLRAVASLTGDYVGQISPGDGVLIIDGPLCVDSFSWWLVESLDGSIRGWSAEGANGETWIVPCPNVNIACKSIVVLTPSITPKAEKHSENSGCSSNQFSLNGFAQVVKDSLLILRSEPRTGEIIGRAGPLSTVTIVDGPICADSSIWWKLSVLESGLVGWATEADLSTCQREYGCRVK